MANRLGEIDELLLKVAKELCEGIMSLAIEGWWPTQHKIYKEEIFFAPVPRGHQN